MPFQFYFTYEEVGEVDELAGVIRTVKMEVSALLKKLDVLNEEGQSIQREIQKTDNALTAIRLECEMSTQVWATRDIQC